MLHSTIVSSEAAEETSTKAIRHRDLQVLPQGSYSFGEVELLPGSCIAIQPIPVLRTVRVNQGGVAPHSLPGGARPRDEAILASGQMRGLGEPLSQVPMPFRHGVDGSRKKIVGDREVRRVGNAFVPMASPARDYERNPIGRDRTIQMTASTTSVLSNFGLAPDDAIRRRSIPATTPGSMVARAPKVLVPIMSPRPRGIPIPLRDATTQRVDLSGPGEDVAQAIGSSIASGIVAAGVATIVVFGGLYWLINRES